MKQEKIRLFTARLHMRGKSVRSWAASRGYNAKTVYGVLSGRLNGSRGVISAKIAKDVKGVLS